MPLIATKFASMLLNENSRCAKLLVRILVLLLLACLHAPIARAATGLLDLDPGFSGPVFEACHTADCEARRDVRDALRLMLERDRPNSLAQLQPPKPDRFERLDRQIARSLAAHPERRKAYCEIALSLARGIADRGDEAFFFAHHLLEFVARTRDGGTDCVSQVVAAFPSTPAFARVVRDVHSDCRYSWHGSHCDELQANAPG